MRVVGAVGVGLDVGVGVGVLVAVGVGVGVRVGVGVGVGVLRGVGTGVGDVVAEGVGFGDAVAEGIGVGVFDTLGVGFGEAVEDGKAVLPLGTTFTRLGAGGAWVTLFDPPLHPAAATIANNTIVHCAMLRQGRRFKTRRTYAYLAMDTKFSLARYQSQRPNTRELLAVFGATISPRLVDKAPLATGLSV